MSEKRSLPEVSEDPENDAKRRRKSRWQETEGESAPAEGNANDLAALQAQIQAQMSNVKQLLAAKKENAPVVAPAAAASAAPAVSAPAGYSRIQPGLSEFKPAPLRLDAKGREVDAGGNLVGNRNSLNNVATLKINTKVVVQKVVKEVLPMIETDPSKNPFYDPNLKPSGFDRRGGRRQAFVFTEEGSEVHRKAADRMRHKLSRKAIAERYGKVQQAPAPIVGGAGGDNPNMVPLGTRPIKAVLPFKQEGPIPEMEWWDAALTPNYVNSEKVTFDESKITIYIEHPIPIEPLCENKDQGAVPLPLTQKERKKLRTRSRIEAEKEKQAQVRVGLLAPPPPKVKISNMMKALLNEAVQDPSKIEQQVRAAMAQRQRNHDLRNEERKLKPEERRQKKLKKVMDETAVEVGIAVYRIEDFSNTQNRYKVDINASQLHLTGCVLLCEEAGYSVVVAEGGKSSLKKFTKLLTQRIKWKDEDAPKSDNDKPGCQWVWQGVVKKPTFKAFRLDDYRTEALARQYLGNKNLAHLWDMCVHK
eukprot:TRINITY_DN1541_c0_g2_i1.p1 TRINITY_DN1541_c0_g2~~TRINITY_DN1541_c0_g2_i1.p1  ORF type:complete len:532 (+),score=97.98 TRINITY_DN1541_c0_g2_i1:94-1689(+)